MKADEHIRRTHQPTDRLMHICRQIDGCRSVKYIWYQVDNRQPTH